MARLELPVMKTRLRAPADRASSAAYWMSGLSTIGSISFGLALVAGRNRVPRPATGNTAVLISFACATADLLRTHSEAAMIAQRLRRPGDALRGRRTSPGANASRANFSHRRQYG